jgi:hypothetical protein
MKLSGWAQVWLVVAWLIAAAVAVLGNMLSEAYVDAMGFDPAQNANTAFVWGVIGVVVGVAFWLTVMSLKGLVNWAERAPRQRRPPQR